MTSRQNHLARLNGSNKGSLAKSTLVGDAMSDGVNVSADIRVKRPGSDEQAAAESVAGRRLLNVGGGSKQIPIPPYYKGYEHHLLDIDASLRPEVLMDARTLDNLEADCYDAVYCSHNLEHYYAHEVPMVLAGFSHIIKPDGFVDIRVPDLEGVIKHMVENKVGLDGDLYKAQNGRMIRPIDIFYGESFTIASSCREYMSHKTGFSRATLVKALNKAGFMHTALPKRGLFEICIIGFLNNPSDALKAQLGLR